MVISDATDRAAQIVLCSQAVLRFFSALDSGDIESVAHLMADRGVWHRQGQALEGPQQVLRALQQRPAGRVTAHLVNNLVIELDPSLNQATARYMLLVFRHDRADGSTGAVPLLSSLLSITDTTDLWQQVVPGQWRAVHKQGKTLFSQSAG